MLEGRGLLDAHRRSLLLVLGSLEIGEEILLGLSALVVAILLGVHGQLKQFFLVLAAVPSVVGHLLAEVVQGVGEQRVRVGLGKLKALLGSDLLQHRIDLSRHAATTTEDHAPHRVVHHHEAALLQGEEVEQRDVLGVL